MVERMCTDADIDDGDRHAAADDAGPPARRVHQAGQGAQARLHGRLGAPEAQRPGAAHGALQGPVQEPRRAGREADRVALRGRRDARPVRWRPSGDFARYGWPGVTSTFDPPDTDPASPRQPGDASVPGAATNERRPTSRRRHARSSTGSWSSASPCSWRSWCGRSCSPTSWSRASRCCRRSIPATACFVNKLSYRLHDPHRGDVVVLHELTGASERDLIKRVIALPGEIDRDPQLRGVHRRGPERCRRTEAADRALPRSAGRRRYVVV